MSNFLITLDLNFFTDEGDGDEEGDPSSFDLNSNDSVNFWICQISGKHRSHLFVYLNVLIIRQ